MSRHNANQGPTQSELRMKAELDRTRRELAKLKKSAAGQAQQPASPPPAAAPAAPASTAAAAAAPAPRSGGAPLVSPEEIAALRQQVEELTATRQRLSRLYFSQVEENRERGRRLQQILENIGKINLDLDLDSMLARIVEIVSASLGLRIVLIALREPGSDRLVTHACVGLDDDARARLGATRIPLEEFRAWLRDDVRVGRSYFISHGHEFNSRVTLGHRPNLGPREEWEWHGDDVLLVPLHDRAGELMGCLSVSDPADRLVPSTESIELLEIFAQHAVVAIENARMYSELGERARQLKESAQHLEELHALKSHFVTTISHELHTPLTALQAVLDTLLSGGDEEVSRDRLRHLVGVMSAETRRLSRLVESVLDLNRFDTGGVRLERQLVDLAEVVRETAGLLAPVAEAGQVTLKVVSGDADTRLEADLDQMRQLVLHLTSNAVKFTPQGGTVTASVSGSADGITLRVEDTGIGIPGDALERVFERFYQVDSPLVRRHGGAGLGLAVCRSIVEWHGGRITAESVPDCGSCFTVALPRRSGSRVALRSDPSAPQASEDLLRLAIEMVAEVLDARVVSLLVPGVDGDLSVRAAIGLDERVVRETRVPVGTGVAGWVAQNRRPMCVANAQESSEIAGTGPTRYKTRTFISVPLEDAEGLLGVLNVTDPCSGQPFDAQDCELLLHLAERVNIALAALRRVEESRVDMQDTARALRQVLSHLERRRFEAPGRVRMARSIAQDMGLPEVDVANISIAASVHDIGMMRLPGSLRESARPFSSGERALMERHVELGAELLRPIEAVGAVRDIVLSHHEWWDGTGYPRGLRGDEIPIGARILAAVDAWESMTVGRSHQPARSEDDARLELERLAGRQFDPRVIEAFVRVWDALRRPPTPEAQQATDDASAIARR